ncbi:P-loop containing nucleoside triphosphate hydrolase protein [Thelephora terrestris]|uniref:P-loop containing nucleoside triphosphate hydrolase protein n=1 Tax=Thelephora terrestris TaxID=56493 RepID=A0A9P6HKH2_9AGAM|nr:P-loop containing nucleoside triphosphate hydrolase protein [Thelephora terrestris]
MFIIEVFTGSVPFGDAISSITMTKILNGMRPERPTHPGFTDDLWALTQQCWEEEPQDRPSMDVVVERITSQGVDLFWAQQPADPRSHGMSRAVPSRGPTRMQTLAADVPPSIPKAPAQFFNRDDILEDLLDLAARSAPVALYGAGGMGKTAIALTLLHHQEIANRFGKYRYFIRCDNLENSVDDLLGSLSKAVGFPRPKTVAQLVSHFEAAPHCILVLDGIDLILDPRASRAAEIATTIGEFGRCPKVCLVATSRVDFEIPGFWRMKVSRLPEEAARRTFHSYCSLEESAMIDGILSELDFHPLSIVLLASAVEENGWDEPALVEEWNDGKTSMLKASGHQSLEDNIESILLTPAIRELGPTARKTLEAIANAPTDVQESELSKKFPGINGVEDAVEVLCKSFLMYRQDGLVKMHSPFRLYFKHTRRAGNPGVPDVQPPKPDVQPQQKDVRPPPPDVQPSEPGVQPLRADAKQPQTSGKRPLPTRPSADAPREHPPTTVDGGARASSLSKTFGSVKNRVKSGFKKLSCF